MTSLSPGVGGGKGGKDNSSTIVIVTASLAAVFFIVLIVLAVVLLLRRRKRLGKGKGEYLSSRMSHSFESPVCSSDMIFLCNVSRRQGNTEVADHLYRNVYHTIQVSASISSSQGQWTLVVWLMHLSYILRFLVFLICCKFCITPLKASVNVPRHDGSMSYIRIDEKPQGDNSI